MTLRTQTPFKYMSKFKAVAADWAFFSSLSDEGQLYCLSEQQVYAIMVQLEYVGWLTRWYNTEDINQTTVDRVKSDIMEALMSCVDVSILVDQANENLITAVTNRAIQSQQLRDVYADEYIPGDPTSINPSAPTTTWSYSGSPDGYDALCAALMAFVYQFARSQADSVRAGQVGGLAAISLIAVLLIPGLNVFFLVGAAIAVLLGLGTVGVTTEVAIQALTDTEALDNVVCCMRDNMVNASVSQATFEASLSGCSFTVGSHEQIIADFLTATLADNYLTFLDFMGTGFDAVTTGVAVPECPCGSPPDGCDGGTLFNWLLSEQGFVTFIDRAIYYASEGWGYNPAVAGNRIAVMRNISPHATKIRVWTSHTVGACVIYSHTPGVSTTPLGTATYIGADSFGHMYQLSVVPSYTNYLMIELQASSFAPPPTVRLRRACINYD